MNAVTLWHNPRCRKSREALQLLQSRGTEVEIIKYLETPPTPAELNRVLGLLGMEPRELMRKKEAPYKDLNLKDPAKSREELITAMVTNPILIERAVAIKGDRAALGRPPENVLGLVG